MAHAYLDITWIDFDGLGSIFQCAAVIFHANVAHCAIGPVNSIGRVGLNSLGVKVYRFIETMLWKIANTSQNTYFITCHQKIHKPLKDVLPRAFNRSAAARSYVAAIFAQVRAGARFLAGPFRIIERFGLLLLVTSTSSFTLQ